MKLKRCPFCHSPQLEFETRYNQAAGVRTYWVSCLLCSGCGPTATTLLKAGRLWNGEDQCTNPAALVANRGPHCHELVDASTVVETSGVFTRSTLTSEQHNTFPKGRWP